ncbi:hypothetical protein DFH06DRAFT_1310745 [Mycena polygramma]|nr:hypothetical protein DFH06DRAFT_1310745 [Mycena polygramma]
MNMNLSAFDPPPPEIVPSDAQTVPPPPPIPEPPDCLFYGWLLEPELFGTVPGTDTITIVCDDGSTARFKYPTTAMKAYDLFELVVIVMRLAGGISFETPTNQRPYYIASLAYAAKGVGVRSRLNGEDKMPSAAKLRKLEEALHLVKKPEWIQTARWSTGTEARDREFDDSVIPFDFGRPPAKTQKAAVMVSTAGGQFLNVPSFAEDATKFDPTPFNKNNIESIFGPSPPTIMLHDAQTVPPPLRFPEPPECLFYGWVLEPELFGPGDITLSCGGVTEKLKRPTTTSHAFDVFELVAGVIGLGDDIRYESPTNTRPRIANFAEAVKGGGIRSRLNGADKIPSAAQLRKLEETLHLDEDSEPVFDALVPPVDFWATFSATRHTVRKQDATFESMLPKPVIPSSVCEDVTMSDATRSHSMSTDLSSIFALPTDIPHDAQTVPPPPHPLDPPKSLLYGWLLTPELFGRGPPGKDVEIVIHFNDPSKSKIDRKRPTATKEAFDVFLMAVIALGLQTSIQFQWLSNEKAQFASLAEVAEGVRVRSRLDGGDKIPPAAKLEKLEEILHLVKKPEWTVILPSTQSEALLREFDASAPPLFFTRT